MTHRDSKSTALLKTALLVALCATPAALPGDRQSAAPQIQSPAAADFPAQRLQAWLSRSRAPGPSNVEAERRELRVLLPRRAYRFDFSCPLRGQPEAAPPGSLQLIIGCSSLAPGIQLSEAAAEEQLSGFRGARESVLGVLYLQRIDLTSTGQISWSWTPGQLRFSNPFLEALHAAQPRAPAPELLNPVFVQRAGGALLRTLQLAQQDQVYRKHRNLLEDWQAVVAPGSWLKLDAGCPLRLFLAARRESGRELYRLPLRIECLQSTPPPLLIGEAEYRRSRLELLRGGRRYTAEILPGPFQMNGNRLAFTIDEIRAVEELR
ncbi:MAG: hypothetical protein K1X75_04965 [Leptospirales bacterium]|nr:hypothetical protein [Leptospirales bacterium]